MDDLGGMTVDTTYSLSFWDPSIAQNWHNEYQETLLVQQYVCDVGSQRHISGRRVQALLHMHRQSPLVIAHSVAFGVSGQRWSSENDNISGVLSGSTQTDRHGRHEPFASIVAMDGCRKCCLLVCMV